MLSLLRVTNFSEYSTAFQEGPHFQDRNIVTDRPTEWYPSHTLIYLHPNNCHEGILALNKLNKQYSNAAVCKARDS